MAAIQSLRKNSWILTLVIGLALLAFIVTGLDTSLFSSRQSNVIATVDGEDYTYDEYNTIFEMLDNQQKSNGQDLSYAQREQVYSQAWRQFLTGKLFENCYKNLGLSVYKENLSMQGISDEEFQDITIGENIDPELQYYFRNPQTGTFDKDMLINVLSNLSTAKEQNPEFYENWIQFEKALHENSLRRKYVALVANGVYVTKLDAEDLAKTKNEQFDISFVRIPYESIADSTIAVKDKDLEKFYKTISTEKRYQQEDGVSFEYVTFDIVPTTEDIKAVENTVTTKAEEFKNAKNDKVFLSLNSDDAFNADYYAKGQLTPSIDSFAFAGQIGDVTPVYFENNKYNVAKITDIRLAADSAKVEHILLTGENAYDVADSLKKVVEAGGDFESLARTYSKDSASAVKGGLIDWFTEGQMVRSFQDSSFFGTVGKLYIAPSQYGVHLIKILDQGPKSKRVQVEVLSKTVTYSQATRQNVYQQAVKFVSENRTKKQFEASVENNQNLVMRQSGNTDENQRVLPGIDESRQVIRWCHQNKDKEDVSEIFRCGDKFVVAVVTGVEKKGAMSFESVKDQVKEEYIKEQKKTKILNDLKSVDCSSLASVAKAESETIKTSENLSFASTSAPGIGIEPALFATLSSMDKGTVSSPIAGERGVFVAQVTNKNTTATTTIDKELATQQQRNASILTNNIYKILEDKADIEDNRINFN